MSKDERNLSEVFRELQQMQYSGYNNSNTKKTKPPKVKKTHNTQSYTYKSADLKLSHIITGCALLIIGMAVVLPKNTSFKTSYAKEESKEAITEYELNRHRLNMQNIISTNSEMERVKEQIVEERDVEFETNYNNNPSLPKGEEVLIQEGALGKEKVTAIQTYENGTFVEEIILNKEKIQDFVPKIIDLGTSEFLANLNIHIGDMIYLTELSNLKKEATEDSEDVAEIKQYLDVKLLELPNEDWCKVSFDGGVEGYIQTSKVTSASKSPNIVEKNRIQRILLKVNINMELNKASGLTLNDYKRIFTDIPNDKNKIFQNNYAVFYNMEKKYNINGIFLASIAIHESAWGTSQIAQDKNNLFGYGSYDSSPYESSLDFENIAEGIETVAKSLVKYYLNPTGTKIYDGENAEGWYYNGPTLQGVNTRYASDENWHNKVYSYMELLYNRL